MLAYSHMLIIDTAMARRVEDAPTDAAYPQVRRFGQMFEASFENPDAEGFLGWRASMTDEEWVEWGAPPDEAWYERVAKDFGLDARSKRRSPLDSIRTSRLTHRRSTRCVGIVAERARPAR